jgi:hypothetical protein
LITTRQTKDNWGALVTRNIIGHKASARYETSYVFPLYLYSTENERRLGTAASIHSFSTRSFIQRFGGAASVKNLSGENHTSSILVGYFSIQEETF